MCNLVLMVINEGETEAVKIIEDRQLKLKITAVTTNTQKEVLTDL